MSNLDLIVDGAVSSIMDESPVNVTHTLEADVPIRAPIGVATGEVGQRLALLYELPLQLGREPRLDLLLQHMVELLIPIIPGATRGALLVKEEETGELLLKGHVPLGQPSVSAALASRAIERREAFVWRRVETAADLTSSQRAIAAGIYAPLLWKEQSLGVICVDNGDVDFAFGSEDLQLMMAVAQHAAMAVATHQLEDNLRLNASVLAKLLTSFSPRIRESLLRKAQRGGLRLGGEKSEVTILFSDIRGFTRLSEEMETEDVIDMLNDYFPALADSIFSNDGSIDKFIGDAILAVFGAQNRTQSNTGKRLELRLKCNQQWRV